MANYDEEATNYQNIDNEAANLNETIDEKKDNETSATTTDNCADTPSEKKNIWKNVAVGAGTGILIGAIPTVLMSMKAPDTSASVNHDTNLSEDFSNPEFTDGNITVATSVNDSMSFSEAFAAARAEVGPGGVFEWHGQLYGTYYADEWNNMTDEQKAEYSDHFNWSHIDHSSSHVAHHSSTATQQTATTTSSDDDDIDIVSVNHNENNGHAQNQTQTQTQTHQETHQETNEGNNDVKIIGVSHNDELDMNVADLTVDGHYACLLDVDNDQVFDSLFVDENDNGDVDPGEVADVSYMNLTVNALGGFSDNSGNLMANNDEPDYSNNDIYEG